jgi:hypothetical protein
MDARIATACLSLGLSGCLPVNALTGTTGTDLSSIVEGTPRAAVEQVVGPPRNANASPFQYSYRKEEKPDVGAALFILAADVISGGLVEYLALDCRRRLLHILNVEYDEGQKVARTWTSEERICH